MSCDRYIDILSLYCTPLVLVVGALDLFDASLFTGLIFVDFYWHISRSRSKTWHHSFLDFWDVSIYIHTFTSNPPLIRYPILEMNLCSLIIFSWLMLIKCVIFKSNIVIWEWLLGTMLTRAMKGTSQGKL